MFAIEYSSNFIQDSDPLIVVDFSSCDNSRETTIFKVMADS